MKAYSFLFFLFFALICSPSLAQNYESDALRFAYHNFGGTARFDAVGGAFTSVGADFSNLSYNPGGIGMYRHSIIQFSPGLNYTKYNSSYSGVSTEDTKFRVVVPSFGLIFANNKPSKNSLFQSSAFGIGLNRMGSYQFSEAIKAPNYVPGASITSTWLNEIASVNGSFDGAVNDSLFSFEAVNAYFAYLVNYDTSLLGYTSPVTDSITQTRYADVGGGKNEFVISAGTNYLDKLYFGATIGIPIINYNRSTRFIEEDMNNANGSFNNFELKQSYKTEAVGFNFKAGLIYRVNDWFRIGGSLQSPERLSFKESWSSSISTNFDTISFSNTSRDGNFDYVLRLPWRASAGASLFFKKSGFLSVDYEAVGYNATRYNFGNDYKEVSDAINLGLRAKYRVGHNLRAGLEVLVKKFRIRAGYNYVGSPIKKVYAVGNYDYSAHVFSGGLGLLLNKWAIDFSYKQGYTKQFEQPYTVNSVQVSGINKNITNGLGTITVAYKLR